MDIKGMLDTNDELDGLDAYGVTKIEWLKSIDEYAESIDNRLKSINGKLVFFEVVLIIGIALIVIQALF